MAVPEMIPLVFIGRNLHSGHAGLYFQDAGSYLGGDRYGPDYWTSAQLSDGEPEAAPQNTSDHWFEVLRDGEFSTVFEFEHALEALLSCSVRRRQWSGKVRPCEPPAGD